MASNTTDTRSGADLLDQIEFTCSGNVDLEGCTTAAEIKAAVKEQEPQMLLQVLVGDGAHDPSFATWLAERSDDITAAIAEQAYKQANREYHELVDAFPASPDVFAVFGQ